MRVLEGSRLEEAIKHMEKASRESVIAPCRTDKRGVVIINEGKIVGKGVNGPPLPFECGEDYCGKSCRVPAIHAEVRALFDAGPDAEGGTLYHARTEDGVLQDSRDPRCADCSKHILEQNVLSVILKQKKGYVLYDAKEFHDISTENYHKRPCVSQK